MPCPPGYHPEKGGCYDKRGNKYQPGSQADTNAKPKRTQAERERLAPTPKKEDRKVKPAETTQTGRQSKSTSRIVLEGFGGDFNKYFAKKAKDRFKTGIPCPFRETNACIVWNLPHKVLLWSYGNISKLYEGAKKVKDELQQEAMMKGYDDAMDFLDNEAMPAKPEGERYELKDLRETDAKLREKADKLISEYGIENLKNPRNNKDRRARSEYLVYQQVVSDNLNETKRLRAELEASKTSTPTSDGGKPQASVKLPGKRGTVSVADVRRARNL